MQVKLLNIPFYWYTKLFRLSAFRLISHFKVRVGLSDHPVRTWHKYKEANRSKVWKDYRHIPMLLFTSTLIGIKINNFCSTSIFMARNFSALNILWLGLKRDTLHVILSITDKSALLFAYFFTYPGIVKLQQSWYDIEIELFSFLAKTFQAENFNFSFNTLIVLSWNLRWNATLRLILVSDMRTIARTASRVIPIKWPKSDVTNKLVPNAVLLL